MKPMFVDTTPIIYLLEGDTARRERVRRFLDRSLSQDVPLCASVVTLAEVLVPAKRVGDAAWVQRCMCALHDLLSFPLRPIDAQVAEWAASIRGQYGFRLPAAMQLAAALAMGCDRFYTNDLALRGFDAIDVVLVDETE